MAHQYGSKGKPLCDNITRYLVLSQPNNLRIDDLCILENYCCRRSAITLAYKIRLHFAHKGIEIPANEGIPVERYLEYKKWNFEYIQKLAHADMKALQQKQVVNC